MTLSATDMDDLRWAKQRLEQPHLANRLARWLGPRLRLVGRHVPQQWRQVAALRTHDALLNGVTWVSGTLEPGVAARQSRLHLAGACATGFIGGLVGAPALIVELPATTLIMLRSIANIASVHGENLDSMEARLQCLQVFALGGGEDQKGQSDTSYYAIRMNMAPFVEAAAQRLAQRLGSAAADSAVARLIERIAARFQIQVTERAGAAIAPVIGAASGAGVNGLFTHQMQCLGEAHFTVRRLERRHGAAVVKAAYERIAV